MVVKKRDYISKTRRVLNLTSIFFGFLSIVVIAFFLVLLFIYYRKRKDYIALRKKYGDFKTAWYFVVDMEGRKCVKEPSGGYSKFGIRDNLAYKYFGKNSCKLSFEEAMFIARKEFWDKYNLSKYPFPLNLVIFDAIYNMGYYGFTSKVLSEVGKKRIESEGDVINVCYDIIREREKFYRKLARSRKYKKYLSGWLKRLKYLKDIVGRWEEVVKLKPKRR